MKTLLLPLTCGLCALVACCLFTAPARAASPEDVLHDHFARIMAQDYTGAQEYFSAAFRRAFKGNRQALDTYFARRQQQLGPGYHVVSSAPLTDTGRQTLRLTVDFEDPDKDAPVTVTERMNYYFVREKVDGGAPQRDSDGLAWRIDIYSALLFDSLADARRLPYLYTREAWPDDESRELRGRQGLYRIQQALEEFKAANGHYPEALSGEDNRRDELLKGERYFGAAYPANGFNGRLMRAVDFGERSSGDFSYYSQDNDGDKRPDSYFLLLHGRVPANYLFATHDTIMILGAGYNVDESQLAAAFAQWWQQTRGKPATPGPALGADWGSPAETRLAAELPVAADAGATGPQDETAPLPPADPRELRLATDSLVGAVLRIAQEVAAGADSAGDGTAQAAPSATPEPLVVHTYGLP